MSNGPFFHSMPVIDFVLSQFAPPRPHDIGMVAGLFFFLEPTAQQAVAAPAAAMTNSHEANGLSSQSKLL